MSFKRVLIKLSPLPPTLSTIKIPLPLGATRLICRSPVAVCSNWSILTLRSVMITPGSGMINAESTSPGVEIASGIALGTSALAKRKHPACGVAVAVGELVAVGVLVMVGVRVGVLVGVAVGVRLGVGVDVRVAVDVFVGVGVRVGVGVFVAVGVGV